MSIPVICPNCGVTGTAKEQFAGRVILCPKCKSQVQVAPLRAAEINPKLPPQQQQDVTIESGTNPLRLGSVPTRGMVIATAVRSLIFLITPTCIFGFGIWEFSQARQYDKDGEVGIGTVAQIKQYSRRSRRGIRTNSFTLTVDGPHGQLTVGGEEGYGVGDEVRYIYSPTLQDAQLIGPNTERGGVLVEEICDWSVLFLVGIALVCIWMAFGQFRLVYKVVTGNFVVVTTNVDT